MEFEKEEEKKNMAALTERQKEKGELKGNTITCKREREKKKNATKGVRDWNKRENWKRRECWLKLVGLKEIQSENII